MALARARPIDLPVPDDGDLQSPRPRRGKGQGESKMAPPESWETPADEAGEKKKEEGGALEKELGEELVRHLMEENQRLKDDLKRARENGSSSKSWSEVEALGPRSQGPMPWSVALGESPVTKDESKKQDQRRYTPNGTQVPEGPPPVDNGEGMDIPPPPGWAMANLANYELEEMSWTSRMRRDNSWRPRPSLKGLSEEVEVLQRKLNLMKTIGDGQGYWSKGFQRQDYEWHDTEEVRRELEKAFAMRDQECPRDGSLGGDRASAWGGKEYRGGEVRVGDRAFARRDLEGPGACGLGGDRAEWHGGHWLGDGGLRGRKEGRGMFDGDQPPPPPPWSSTKDEGEDEERDSLKAIPIVLPKLVEPSVQNAPLEAGDWIAQLTPLIGDVSAQAASWWSFVMGQVTSRYQSWLEAGPLEKLKVECPDPLQMSKGHQRLAQRITTLLMGALPESLRQELVATRQLHVPGIMFSIFKKYQPGGLREKTQTLAELTGTKPAMSPVEAVERLRLWRRQMLRAVELHAALPDPVLQVKALDVVMQELLKKDAQSMFRISTYRLQHQVDVKPSVESVQRFFDLLLAEAEYMMTSASLDGASDTTSSQGAGTGKASVKSMTTTSSPQKTGDKPFGSVPCRWWGSDRGCRMGRSCKFSHEGQLQNRNARCWLCSSTEHRRFECPTREGKGGGKEEGGESRQSKGLPDKGDGKGVGKWKGGKQKGESKGSSGTNGASVAAVSASEREGDQSGEKAVEGQGSSGDKVEDRQASTGETLMSEVTSLLKSLRTQNVAVPQIRACGALQVEGCGGETLLDGGATHCLRTAEHGEWEVSVPVKVQLASTEVQMRMHPWKNTLLVPHQVQAIVPIGKLTSVGYKVQWESGKCEVVHPEHGKIPVKLHQGCPVVDKKWGQRLMREVEAEEERMVKIRAVCLGRKIPESSEEKDVSQLQKWFPEVPVKLLEMIPGTTNWDPAQLPFNRHRRRQIDQAKTVVINLFSGGDVSRWKKLESKSLVVVNLDLLNGGDLLNNPHLAGWIQHMAKSGKVDFWTAGPPCRSVSWCRYRREDDGPPPLRTRSGSQRFGLEGLTGYHIDQAQGDAVMFLRTLWWFRLSHEAKRDSQFALEQPLDPEEWVREEELPTGGAPSFMVWRETKETMEALGLRMVRLDQGALGHETRKPTMVATNVVEVQQLDGLKSDSYTLQKSWQRDLADRIQQSKKLAQWAPGFCDALKKAMVRIHNGGVASVRTLTMKERQEIAAWQDHYRCGHMPFRKDCETCLISAGRSRPHRKLACPTSMCLSLDIMGPFVSGRDQEGVEMKYGMVAVYTVPTN